MVRTRQSQNANLATESPNEGHASLQSTTDIDVPLQRAVGGQRVNPKRSKRNLGKKRTSATSDTPATQNAPPDSAPSDSAPPDCAPPDSAPLDSVPLDSAPPAKRARKKGPNVGRQEKAEARKERTSSTSANRGQKSGTRDKEPENGIATEEDSEQGRAHSVGVTQGKRPRLRRSYGFYGHSQNDQPHDNIIYSDSENDIENEADWHDEPPRLNLSQANEVMNVETPIWQASATCTSPGVATSQASQLGSATSQASRLGSATSQTGRSAMSQANVNGNLPQPGSGGSAPLLQGGASVALLSQGGGGVTISMPGPATTLVWPTHTDLVFQEGKKGIMLMVQQPLVQVVLQDAIDILHMHILSVHAYPEPAAALSAIRDSLLRSARSHFPGTLSIHNRIHSDKDYVAAMSQLLRARIPHFRGDVKDACTTILAAELPTIGPPAQIKLVVNSQLKSYNYMFPMAPNAMKPTGRARPYRNDRIIRAIRSLYFTGGAGSFASRFSDTFPFRDGPDGVMAREAPVPMVALVATALYAALNEWSTGVHQTSKFSANAHLDTYNGHIGTLNEVCVKTPNGFRLMMVEIYSKAKKTVETTALIAEIDWDELEE